MGGLVSLASTDDGQHDKCILPPMGLQNCHYCGCHKCGQSGMMTLAAMTLVVENTQPVAGPPWPVLHVWIQIVTIVDATSVANLEW